MKELRAGFFAGEFGWELMRWQANIGYIANDYDKVIIGCEMSHRFLYKDFATEFVDFPLEIKSRNMWYTNGRVYPMSNDNCIIPSRKICLSEYQKFIKYGNRKKELGYDILIHARYSKNMNTGYRNWCRENWVSLVELLKNYNMASIGTREDALWIPGTIDNRDVQLSKLADTMASSKMIIGPSSGPMHLASLCGLKHIVWSDKKTVGIMNNEKRYKDIWNPFGTECKFIPTWQPGISQVEREVIKWL